MKKWEWKELDTKTRVILIGALVEAAMIIITLYIKVVEKCFDITILKGAENILNVPKILIYNPGMIVIAIVMIAIGILSFINIKNFFKGTNEEVEGIGFKEKDGTHGTANFSDVRELTDILTIGNEENTKGIIIGKTLDTDEIITLPDSYKDLNRNIFVIGASGSGKSRKFLIPNILKIAEQDEKIENKIKKGKNIVCTDPKGDLYCKCCRIKPNPDIIIIPEDRWQKANDLIDGRSRKGERVIRLLSGLTRCGYCNAHICPKGKTKWTYMLCKGKQRTGFCEYTANYRIDRLEEIVSNEVRNFLKTLKKIDVKELIISKAKDSTGNEENLSKVDKQIEITNLKIKELKSEVMEALLSGNQDLQEKISYNINIQNENLKNLQIQKTKFEAEIRKLNNEINNLKQCIPNWEKEFKKANLDNKRIIINELIDKIYLFNDKIEIHIKYPIENYILKVGKND